MKGEIKDCEIEEAYKGCFRTAEIRKQFERVFGSGDSAIDTLYSILERRAFLHGSKPQIYELSFSNHGCLIRIEIDGSYGIAERVELPNRNRIL